MERTGEVTAVVGDQIEITFCRPSDCEKCGACHGGRQQTAIRLPGKARVGDIAVVDMPMKTLMHASALAYGLPLIGMLGGLVLGAVIAPDAGDVAPALGALCGLTLCVGIAVITESRRRKQTRWQPTLIEIIPKEK